MDTSPLFCAIIWLIIGGNVKKLFAIILFLLLLFIPNTYAEELKYYEIKMFEKEVLSDITYEDEIIISLLLNNNIIKTEQNNNNVVYFYDNDMNSLFSMSAYNSQVSIEIPEDLEIAKLKYDFTSEDKEIINTNMALFTDTNDDEYLAFEKLSRYDGVILYFKDIKEITSDKECTSVCINKVTIENNADLNKTVPTFDGLELNFDLAFEKVTESVKYKVNINNPTNKDYEIGTENKFSESNYITYEYSFDDEDNILKANSDKTMYVTVRYDKELPSEEFTNGTFKEDNKAVIDLSNGVKDDPIKEEVPTTTDKVEVPDTYTGLSICIVFAFIALLGYLSYNKLSNKRLLLVIIPIILIPIIVNAYEKLEVKVNTHIEIKDSKNILEARNGSGSDLWSYGNKIKTITFENRKRTLKSYSWKSDISEAKDKSIIAYLVPIKDSNYYDLYIMANGTIYANQDSSGWFSNMSELEKINNLNYLNTKLVTDMSDMFNGCSKIESLDVSTFDLSNVTDMSEMFCRTGIYSGYQRPSWFKDEVDCDIQKTE